MGKAGSERGRKGLQSQAKGIRPRQKIPFVPRRSELTLRSFVEVIETLRKMVVHENSRIRCCENQNPIHFGNLSLFPKRSLLKSSLGYEWL